MAYGIFDSRDRLRGALGAVAVEAILAWLLIAGFTIHRAIAPEPAAPLLAFTVPPPAPPPREKPAPKAARPKAEGAAAPANRVSKATEIVAPLPALVPPPIVVAPKPAQDVQASSGAAPLPGPGTGAGGQGEGTGSGGHGNGPGGGGGTVLRLIRGELRDSDYPRSALDAGAAGTVHLRFTVGVNGRVTECEVTRSSGNADLDETTCRLIQKRFRYEPSRDASGRPYADIVTGEHVWTLYDRRSDRRDRESSTDG
jgi:periplasmic protein TonB